MSGGAAPARPVTHVAVGVLVRADGAVLLADRPAGKPYAGYWEFPGGKIEAGESVDQALARELAEELGVVVAASLPWVTLEYDYPHAYVRLYFRRIHAWTGTPRPVEAQQLRFLMPAADPPAPLLPAAIPAMRWIQLPTTTGFSPQSATRAAEAIQWLEDVLGRGLLQIIWHEPLLAAKEGAVALARCSALAAAYGARLLVDSRSQRRFDSPPAGAAGGDGAAHGRYLCAAELRACSGRGAQGWLGTAVEDASDLARAAALGCDFVVVETGRERGAAAQLCRDAPLPVYLAWPPDLENLRAAQAMGAHGLAMGPGGD